MDSFMKARFPRHSPPVFISGELQSARLFKNKFEEGLLSVLSHDQLIYKRIYSIYPFSAHLRTSEGFPDCILFIYIRPVL